MCVWWWGGEGVQFYIFVFVFFSFCRNLALNNCKFSLPCYVFFSPAQLNNSNDE